MTYFIDTNILLRFLTRDDKNQYQACRQLFQKAKQGKIDLTTSALVIFELVWTLNSYYGTTKENIVEKVLSLMELPNLTIESKSVFLESLLLWQQKNLEFNDAFNYVWAKNKKITKVFSYDKHFDRFPQIQRLEP